MQILKIIIATVAISSIGISQIDDKTYSLSTELGVGYSRYFTTMDYDDLNQNGFSGTVKVMWNPEHLLSIGLETGYQYLYSLDVSDYSTEFGNTNVKASMYTVPVFIVFSMKVLPNIKLSAGSGVYLLFNSGELFGDELSSNQISIGAHMGISYTYPINNSMAIGGELLYSYFSKLQDQTVAIQFLFVYDFFRY
ncbi:MAG: outer membrane beta-barrel protein [Ignavibacteriaceae bacterium]|nr:outer membrane beta-barrel protein [Ignavibacteriaceae bacterium]